MTKKQDLRKKFLENRDKMTKEEISKKNKKIYESLINSEVYNKCKKIFVYVSMKNEVDTKKIISKGLKEGKIIGVPKVEPRTREMYFSQIQTLDELEIGHFGVLEPKKELIKKMESDRTTLVLVPGAVFDKNRNRIGYGGGYYDRYLGKHTSIMKTIGLAYDFQVIDAIPTDTYDIPLNLILTENNWIY
ncbi:MAG: 5-formyltetrahydrofolate cyclo-ligase [Epulopiscium sp.]|nr:5-formyltetrahydrofolate cyclo-ligase [Candidatus Epulonipiscium sp.]